MSKSELQIKIINWLANEATEQQLEGLVQLLEYEDIIYGLELIFGKEAIQEFIKDIKEDN